MTFRWMTNPASSLKIIQIILASYTVFGFVFPDRPNPIAHLIIISYRLPLLPEDEGVRRYDKGLHYDAAFLAFYIVVFSFIRQTVTEYGVKPVAIKLGLKGRAKLERFMEQGYAMLYFLCSSLLGLVSLLSSVSSDVRKGLLC